MLILVTRTSFDMDPFVIASLGRKTYRTRVVRHNLNPVFDEKMVFQVSRYEQNYSINFSVVDRDKLSGNDFVGTATLPLSTLLGVAPEADPETGLYRLPEPPEMAASTPLSAGKPRFRIPISRSSSSSNLSKGAARPNLSSRNSQASLSNLMTDLNPDRETSVPSSVEPTSEPESPKSDPLLRTYNLPVTLKKKDRWESKYSPQILVRAKYLPYPALRQQFWRAMLKQYDADENSRVSKLEMTTMLDTLGSTLKDSTIENFFKTADAADPTLSYDEAVICLEEQLRISESGQSWSDYVRAHIPSKVAAKYDQSFGKTAPPRDGEGGHEASVETINSAPKGSKGEDGDFLRDDLMDEGGEEHIVEIRECPLCHQPRLNKSSDADIITHIATCASQDWRQVNNIVMAGFVTSSQAQRKWYSKVITKISYGGYKLGANSANILVQDRLTGQINEERMSVYVRIGIRLLYKGLKSRDMEKKRSRSCVKEYHY